MAFVLLCPPRSPTTKVTPVRVGGVVTSKLGFPKLHTLPRNKVDAILLSVPVNAPAEPLSHCTTVRSSSMYQTAC
jgi:hypothetical protein